MIDVNTLVANRQKRMTPQQPQKGGGLADLLPFLGGVAGGVIGLPFGGVGGVAGGALGSGAGDLLKQLLAGKGFNAGETAQEVGLGALGGAGGLIGGKILGAGARALGMGGAEAASQAAGRTAAETAGEGGLGATIRKGVLNPKAAVGATQAGKEAELAAAQEGFGLKGGPGAQKIQVNNLYNGLQDELQTLAGNSKKTVPFDTLKDLIKKDVTQSGTYFIPNEKPYENALRAELSLLEKDSGGGASLQRLLTSKDKLAAGIKNFENPVSVREQVKKDIWDVIDSSITKIEPEAKAITGSQSMLHKLEPGLAERSKQGVSLPLIGKLPGPLSETIMGSQDALGRGIQGAASKIPTGTASNVVGQGAARSLFGPSAPATTPAELSNNTTQGTTPTGLSGMNLGQDQSNQNPYPIENYAADVQHDPKNAAIYKQLYDEYQKQFATKKLSATAQTQLAGINSAQNIVNELEQNLSSVGTTSGPSAVLSGIGKSVGGALQLNPKAAGYEALRQGAARRIIKALGEVGTLSGPDIQAAVNLIPGLWDSTETATIKLQNLKDLINAQKTAFSGESNDTGDTSQILQQLVGQQ